MNCNSNLVLDVSTDTVRRKIGMIKKYKKMALALGAGAALIGGVIQPLAVQAYWRQATNENAKLRVYLNYFRIPDASGVNPIAYAGARALTDSSRRLRVDLRWYSDKDLLRIDSGWRERPNVVPLGGRIARNTYWGDAWVYADTRNGRFRTSAQRMIYNQASWNTSSVGTVKQSRSWNMR